MREPSNSVKKYAAAIVMGAIAAVLLTSPAPQHVVGSYHLQSGYSNSTPIRLAGVLCYGVRGQPEVC
jgi:hypothetical protein